MVDCPYRVGSGFDVHRFTPDRKLVLGGVQIDHPLGLEGHSDADVLLHALCDAMLGAISLGDIGQHFPPDDSEFKDISSLLLLEMVTAMLRQDKWRVTNVDVTVICERPKVLPYVERIKHSIAPILDLPFDAVSIKGTTTERLGFTGREEGIAVMATVLVSR